jgi:hypothetical protein
MRVVLDRDVCIGSGTCCLYAPDAFELDPPRRDPGLGVLEDPRYVPPDVSLLGDDHVKVYTENSGKQGYPWNGAPILLLITTGWKTGQATKTTALIFGRDGSTSWWPRREAVPNLRCGIGISRRTPK